MKKFLSLTFLFFAATLFLTACGETNAEAPAEEAETAETPAAESDEIIEISFWHYMAGPHEAALLDVIDAFHAEFPHIRVDAQFQGNEFDLNETVIASAVAGLLPHIVQQTTDTITDYISEGLVVNLTPFITDAEIGLTQAQLNDIMPTFRDGMVWDGEFMAIPHGKTNRVLFYNVTLFEEFGLTVPTSWEELVETAAILTDLDNNRFGMGFENSWGNEFIALNRLFGGEYIDPETGLAVFGEQAGIDAATFVFEMVDNRIARFAGEDNRMSGVFGNQAVAMYAGAAAGLPHVAAAIDGQFEWNTAPLPSLNGDVASRFIGPDLAMMNNNATEAEQLAAWEFMKFTLRPEIASSWAAATGYVPFTYSALNHEYWTNFLAENPHAVAAAEQFEAGFLTARVTGANTVWNILIEELNMIRDNENPLAYIETALERAQERANEALN